MAKINFLKKKPLSFLISALAFLVGFFLIEGGGITGNVILNDQPLFTASSLIGILLVIGSGILAFYAIRQD
jgi:hypothetical protein